MRHSSFSIRLIAAAATIALLGAGCGDGTEGKFGQELFEQVCAACHGATGSGTTGRPAINAGSNAATLSDDQIRGVIRAGPGAMPSFTRFSDDQVSSLVEYLRTLQGVPPND